jgi:hypothetical protein
LIIKTGASDEDFIIKGNDGGSEVTALTLDMSAAGAAAFNSTVTATGFIIGSANINETELEIIDGATITTTELNIIDGDATVGTTAFADGDGIVTNDNGTMRQTSATTLKTYMSDLTLTTAAQTNITSVGTLTALTVDDVAVNGKVITMTGSSSDTAVFTAGTNGTLSIVTTDDAAASANITITADGTFEADGTTITLDSGGDIVLDADGGDIFLKDDGVQFGELTNSSTDFVIKSTTSDKDIIFKGNDGGSAITALTLDMSDAGAATFNDKVTVGDGKLVLNSTAVTSTAAELNILDDATVTTAELNLIDGGTARGTTALADGDGILINDGGTMRMTNVTTVKTYMQEGAGFASGTDMIFFQAAAPTGWTKSTSNNDKALRVVSGDGGGTGGSAAFSSPAHNLTAAAHTLALNEIPAHSHGSVITSTSAANTLVNGQGNFGSRLSGSSSGSTANAGGGAGHTHNSSGSITTPQYIDVIVAAKD